MRRGAPLVLAVLLLAPGSARAQGPVPGVDPAAAGEAPLLDLDAPGPPAGLPAGGPEAALRGALAPADQAVVDQGVADWTRIHADVLGELRTLGASEDPDDQLLFAQRRAELMRAVAGPLFQAAGLEMPSEDDPVAAQQMLRTLLGKVGKLTGGGASGFPDPSAGLPDLMGDGPASADGPTLPTGMGALRRLLQGAGGSKAPEAPPEGDLWIGPGDQAPPGP